MGLTPVHWVIYLITGTNPFHICFCTIVHKYKHPFCLQHTNLWHYISFLIAISNNTLYHVSSCQSPLGRNVLLLNNKCCHQLYIAHQESFAIPPHTNCTYVHTPHTCTSTHHTHAHNSCTHTYTQAHICAQIQAHTLIMSNANENL